MSDVTTTIGTVQIGYTGTKLHPAILEQWTDESGRKREFLQAVCSCPGTQNGHARLRWLGESVKPNCGPRRK